MMASISDDTRAKLTAAIPRGRFAEASEMCTAAAFLAAREARHVTGVVLPVDGGISM